MSFIRDFMEYNVDNECPRDYILWAAYAALSLAVGRRVFMDLEQFFIVPNLYVCLVGTAGNRKTFARDKAMDLLQECIPDIIVSAECETKQGITAYLGAPEQLRTFTNHKGVVEEYRPYGLFASELMNYLALDPAGMVTFLTDIFDRRFYRYRLKKEEHVLVNPYVVMLTCTVPEWLTRQIRSDEFCSGFGRRTIFVCNDSDIRKKPHMSDASKRALDRCRHFMKNVKNVVGEFKLTPEADHWFWETWYKNYKLPDDKFLKGWGRSKHIQMLKVSILTCVSELPDITAPKPEQLIITKPYLELSLELLNEVEKNIPMITSRMGRSELVEPSLHLLSIIRNHGGYMLEKELKIITFKDFRDSREQWQILEHLKQTEQLRAVPVNVGGVVKTYIALPECVKIEPKVGK